MNRYPLVSIIIPIYNVEPYVEQCILSVRNQTYKYLEIILVDDGSPDHCGAICDFHSEQDNRVKVFHQVNGGLSSARNIGIEFSNGEYLMFVDGDDWIDLDMVEILLELCIDYDAEIAECQYREVISPTRFKRQSNTGSIILMNSQQALESMLDWKYCKPMAWGKLYHKNIIQDIRFPLNKLHEDEFTTYKYVFNAKKVVFIELIKYNYNQMREDGITSQFSEKNLDACDAFLERRCFFEQNGLVQLQEKMNNAYCMVVLDSLYKCWQNKISGKRVEALLQQVRNDIIYFENEPIDIFYVNELKIAIESLKQYSQLRKDREEKTLFSLPLNQDSKSYDEILMENELLKHKIQVLLDSKTWRYAQKIKHIFHLFKTEYSDRTKVDSDYKKNNTTITELQSEEINADPFQLLSAPEQEFLKYKQERNLIYPLELKNINLPCIKDRVTIVLPVYNGEAYIAEAIESILAQSYIDYELLILDDGSTDSTAQIIDEYEKIDGRIKVIHQENIRLPKTLSKGFRLGCGEYYTWISADNIMHRTFLQEFVSDLKKQPQVGMLWGNMRLIDENGEAISDNRWYANAEYPEEVMFPRSPLALNTVANNYIGAAFLYRAVCANIIGDYSACKFGIEDYDYWMKMNEMCVLQHTTFDDALYSYRFHSNSLTSKDKELKITENRYKTMLLDQFRRDYYLKPGIWLFYYEDFSNSICRNLKKIIRDAGHHICDKDESLDNIHNIYEPIIIVCFKDIELRPNIPGAFKVLITDDPRNTKENWDCCITPKAVEKLPVLDAYRGWFSISSCETIFSFIDAKAKTKFLYDIELKMDSQLPSAYKLSLILIDDGDMEALKKCLASVNRQEIKTEVLFVTDMQIDSVALPKMEVDFIDIKVVRSYSKNHAIQMNIGIWQSSGDIIIFGEPHYLYENRYMKTLVELMAKDHIKIVCGSVKCGADASENQRNMIGEHRFYIDKLVKEPELCYAYNVAMKKQAVLMTGGIYHKGAEKDYHYGLYNMMTIISKYSESSIYKSSRCTVRYLL